MCRNFVSTCRHSWCHASHPKLSFGWRVVTLRMLCRAASWTQTHLSQLRFGVPGANFCDWVGHEGSGPPRLVRPRPTRTDCVTPDLFLIDVSHALPRFRAVWTACKREGLCGQGFRRSDMWPWAIPSSKGNRQAERVGRSTNHELAVTSNSAHAHQRELPVRLGSLPCWLSCFLSCPPRTQSPRWLSANVPGSEMARTQTYQESEPDASLPRRGK
ncbi:hypothetical protein BKA63DRAFT_71294 [Paraphoma chrysanthemicola]|nr:hypothetical protein BKA63DRAFT_71294 [Paraphoma chrysanthemicola]